MTVFAPPAVDAASGWMTFSGAIAEPTCDTAAEVDVKASVDPSRTDAGARRLTCGTPGGATAYVLTAAHLSGTTRDPALKYFDDYVKADRPGMDDPLLLTRTYE